MVSFWWVRVKSKGERAVGNHGGFERPLQALYEFSKPVLPGRQHDPRLLE